MYFLSIDIETTGLDPKIDQILEFGCVLGDFDYSTDVMELPTFQTFFKYDRIAGDPLALAMNHSILELIAKQPMGFDFIHPSQLGCKLYEWLRGKLIGVAGEGKDIVDKPFLAAGKNFDKFDRQFLNRLERFEAYVKLHKGALDPGNLYFCPALDQNLPDTNACCMRAGITPYKAHTALGDARTVVALIRNYYKDTFNGPSAEDRSNQEFTPG